MHMTKSPVVTENWWQHGNVILLVHILWKEYMEAFEFFICDIGKLVQYNGDIAFLGTA